MNGCTNAFCAALPGRGVGTMSRPIVPRFPRSSCVPSAEETCALLARLSARPDPGFRKSVNLNVAKLFGLTIHDVSSVPIFSEVSNPVPVVGACSELNAPDVWSVCEFR